MSSIPTGLLRVVPTPEWAGVLSRFDAEVFGDEAWTPFAWAAELSSAATFFAYVEGERAPQAPVAPVAVGGIVVGPDADILTIGVAEARRGDHLGGMMLDDLLATAREGGAEYVFLEVRESNERARALYESRGFVVVGRRKNYYRREDGLTMRLWARE